MIATASHFMKLLMGLVYVYVMSYIYMCVCIIIHYILTKIHQEVKEEMQSRIRID